MGNFFDSVGHRSNRMNGKKSEFQQSPSVTVCASVTCFMKKFEILCEPSSKQDFRGD